MKLTLEAARKRVAGSKGARKRELTARHLLLHPQEVSTATPEEIDWLRAYLFREGWRTLYAHDRRMYRLLREGAGKLADLDDRLLRGEIGGYRKWLAGRDVDSAMLETETALIMTVLDRRSKPSREVSYKLGLLRHLRDPKFSDCTSSGCVQAETGWLCASH